MTNKHSAIIGYKEFLTNSTRDVVRPSIWKWEDIESYLEESLSDEFLGDGRGAACLVNMDTKDSYGTTPHVNVVVQVLKPGVQDANHKHTNMAMFLVFEGEGYSVIDGEKIEWKKGDLVYAPAWLEHEHFNSSDTEDAILFTFQDVPLVSKMGTWFIEEPVGTGARHVVKRDK